MIDLDMVDDFVDCISGEGIDVVSSSSLWQHYLANNNMDESAILMKILSLVLVCPSFLLDS